MFVTVIAMNEGHTGARRAGRYFPNGQEVVLEVIPSKDGEDPPEVGGRPDPARIGPKSFEALKKDPRIKLLADTSTQVGLSRAAYEEARRRAQESASNLEGATLEIARLEDENKQLRERLAELEASTPARRGSAPAPHASAPAPQASGSSGPSGAGGEGEDTTHSEKRPRK